MAYYVRKFARAKWSLLEKDTNNIFDNYKADTIANDLRTQGNTLSLWRVDSLLDSDIEPAIVINSLLGDTIARLDLLFIPEQLMEDFLLKQEDGNTIVENYRNLHYNVVQLSVGKHIQFAKEVILKVISLENENVKKPNYQPLIRRYQEKQQIELVSKWIGRGEIDYCQLKEKQKKALGF